MLRRMLTAAVVGLLLVGATGCSSLANTTTLTTSIQVGAMAPITDGGLRVAERVSGEVYNVDSAGERSEPLVSLPVSLGGYRGVLGLAIDAETGETFVAWTDANEDRYQVARIDDTETTTIWEGPAASTANLGGKLAFTPTGRLAMTIGAGIDNPEQERGEESLYGTIITLDPDGEANQRPNVISTGWTNPAAMAYDGGGNLWVGDGDVVSRVSGNGVINEALRLDDNVGISGMTVMGNQELAVCSGANQKLQRYLISDGTRLTPGREVAEDCFAEVAELSDGRLAYASSATIEVTEN